MSFWVKITIVLAMLLAAFSWHVWDKREAAIAERNKIELFYSQKAAEESHKRDLIEQQLIDSNAEALEKKNDKIKSISSKLDATLSSLQFYRECSSIVPKATSITAPCPSRELSRQDAEFLAREAAKADSVVEERDYYYGQYEKARSLLGTR